MNQLRTIFTDPFKGIDVSKLIEQAMEDQAPRILDLNKQQLDRGLDAKGKSLGKYRNFKYKNRYQPVDLLNKGPFRQKFTLSPGRGPKDKKQAEIFSQDEKQELLVKKYGQDIEGLSHENTGIAADIIKPNVQEGYKNQLLK